MQIPLIAPSILSADFARLAEQVREAEAAGADWLHIDVMDGRFVPNITIGPVVLAAIRPITQLPLDVHLMIQEPERYLQDFARAGANRISVHVETCPHLHRSIEAIHGLGLKAGVAINPATSLTTLEEIIPLVDQFLLMSVNPGFGGQRYIASSTAKIARLRAQRDAQGSTAEIIVDGGVTVENARLISAAGATVLVAGTAIFGGPEPIAQRMNWLRSAAG